jgi:hypothetical protein
MSDKTKKNEIVKNRMYLHYHNDKDGKIKGQLKYYKRMLKNDKKADAILNNPYANLVERLKNIKAYYKKIQAERKIEKLIKENAGNGDLTIPL